MLSPWKSPKGMKARRIGNSCMKGPLFTLQAITTVNSGWLAGGTNPRLVVRGGGGDLPARNPLGHPRASPSQPPPKCFENEICMQTLFYYDDVSAALQG